MPETTGHAWHDKTVLVAGGAGFIGRHLCEASLARGAEVIIVDDFSTGRVLAVDRLSGCDRVTVLKADVAKPLVDMPRCDIVFNLAAPASPPLYQRDPVQTWRTSVYGTDNLASLAHSWGAVFVQASTSEVYGDPDQHPQTEAYWGNVNPVGIRSCYDEGKRAAETLIMDMVRAHGLNGRIARIFNTYGPGMDTADGRLLPNLITQALNAEPMTVYGDGQQTRSLCYVDDLVSGLIAMAQSEAARGEVINLGNARERTVLEIAHLVAASLSCDPEIVHLPLPRDDPIRRCPNVSKAKRILQWSAQTPLSDGLTHMVADFMRATC